MIINKNTNGSLTTSEIVGRSDTTTSLALESEVDNCLANTQELVLDFHGLEYISSVGLRVLLRAQKSMAQKGNMKVLNVNEAIMEVFLNYRLLRHSYD